MNNKIIKIETLESHITYDLDGNLDNVIKYLQDLKERYQKDYFELHIDISYHHDDIDISLMGKREETKEEETSRLLFAEQQEATIKEKELKQLEILKKKYEQGNTN
jgi:hypothetical protein